MSPSAHVSVSKFQCFNVQRSLISFAIEFTTNGGGSGGGWEGEEGREGGERRGEERNGVPFQRRLVSSKFVVVDLMDSIPVPDSVFLVSPAPMIAGALAPMAVLLDPSHTSSLAVSCNVSPF